MGIKKKLGLGVGAAALGLSLIGGGTLAYFNDTATVNNQFAAGTLNLDVQKENENNAINFDLRNMKPGDNATRYFILKNAGSLSIKDVLMDIGASDFVDGMVKQGKASDSNIGAFLSQFRVDFVKVENPSDDSLPWDNRTPIIASASLADLVSKNYSAVRTGYVVDNRINLASTGLNVGDQDGIGIKITFVNQGNQNIYQGDSVKVSFNLEARQQDGVNVKTNGYIKSNEDNSTSVTTDNSDYNNITSPVTDTLDNPQEW